MIHVVFLNEFNLFSINTHTLGGKRKSTRKLLPKMVSAPISTRSSHKRRRKAARGVGAEPLFVFFVCIGKGGGFGVFRVGAFKDIDSNGKRNVIHPFEWIGYVEQGGVPQRLEDGVRLVSYILTGGFSIDVIGFDGIRHASFDDGGFQFSCVF
jgi:hypothetical protein